MSSQILGKRQHSSLSSPSSSRGSTPPLKLLQGFVAFEPPSPDPTPNPKRIKIYPFEIDDDHGSNKENIAPEPIAGSPASLDALPDASNSPSDASTLSVTMTPRELRASRRSARDSGSLTTPRRRTPPSKSRLNPSSIHISTSSPKSKEVIQPRLEVETPSKRMAHLSLSTPPQTPVSMRVSPSYSASLLTETESSLYTLARALLRPQNDHAPLIGRERERTTISEFLEPFLSGQPEVAKFSSLYISGAPGTGKTALVNEMLRAVSPTTSHDQAKVDSNDAFVRIIYVNCMALDAKDGMKDVWERCLVELGMGKKQRGAFTKLDWAERFGKLLGTQKCILVLDEIDHLISESGSTTASQIFDIASTSLTRHLLRVIGISNTHTLTHSKPSPYTQTLHFEPYNAGQMKAVLGARLNSLPENAPATKLFPASTLALLTLKIANQTGDIRTVFSVARRALDIALAASQSPTPVIVTPTHVLAALKASNASISASQGSNAETVTRVRNLGLHARFVLVALLLAGKRLAAGMSLTASSSSNLKENVYSSLSSSQGRDTATPTIDVTALHGFYDTVLSRSTAGAFSSVGRTEFTDLLGLLEGNGLVRIAQNRGLGNRAKSPRGKGTQAVSVASGIREEELVRGLTGSWMSTEAAASNVQEEEVKHVWEREIGRIGNEVKARLADTNNKQVYFEGAEED